MEISKRAFALILCLLCISSFAFGYGWQSGWFHRNPNARVNLFVFAETAHGRYQLSGGNVITDYGEKYVRDILGFNNVTDQNATKWISLSNDASPDQTWTKLPNEVDDTNGFGRALGTVSGWVNAADWAYNVTKKFTATGTQQLQCVGLHWSGGPLSDYNLFACAAFTQTTFNANDNCTIVWVITWDAN